MLLISDGNFLLHALSVAYHAGLFVLPECEVKFFYYLAASYKFVSFPCVVELNNSLRKFLI